DLTARNLVLVLDEDCAERLEPPDDMLVVDDLVAYVDRGPVLLEQPLDDLDRAVEARAKRPRSSQQDALAHATASSRFNAALASRASRAGARGGGGKARAQSERHGLHVNRVGPARLVQAGPLRRVVDDAARAQDRAGPSGFDP